MVQQGMIHGEGSRRNKTGKEGGEMVMKMRKLRGQRREASFSVPKLPELPGQLTDSLKLSWATRVRH